MDGGGDEGVASLQAGEVVTMKPTPGPWQHDKEANVVFRVVGDRDADIAIVVDEDAGPLISAAPDLLEALEMLRETWTGTSYAQWTTEMHAADCAIAKARGQ